MFRRPTLTLAACLSAGRAKAHSFEGGSGFYDQFVDGTLVVLAYPPTLLPLLALGLLVTLWQTEGLLRAWPVLLAGQALGIPLAAAVGPWVGPVLMAGGLLVAGLAALLPRHAVLEVQVAALGIGLLALSVSLEGHGFLELPLSIHAGILFAANLAVAVAAGVARVLIEATPADWPRILCRVLASWIAAVLVLNLAFVLAG